MTADVVRWYIIVAERRGDVDVEESTVTKTEVAVVTRIDAQLSVGTAEILFEKVTARAFVANDGL